MSTTSSPQDSETDVSDTDAITNPDELRETISTVYHDLNNPLSIISGNAQFLLELSRSGDVDEQFVQSIKDIQEAADQMSDSLSMLTEMKEKL